MAKNKIQFQRGMSLYHLLSQYGTEQQCHATLFRMRWPNGFKCPHCGHSKYCEIRCRKVYQCNRCHAQTSVINDTIFAATKLPLRIWFLGVYLITQSKDGISSLNLARTLGISANAALRMKHKLQQAMKERDDSKPLNGVILMDDAYWGGRKRDGKRGRGASGKMPFVASDGLNCFPGVRDADCYHAPINTCGAEYDEFKVFKWVNTMIGNVKNAIHGTYHSVSKNHLPRYLAEFCYRFNRRFQLDKMVDKLISVATRTPPMPQRLLKLAEVRW